MIRTVLLGHQWAAIEPHCLGKPDNPGHSSTDGAQKGGLRAR